MASRDRKPKPISINPGASHKPEDEPNTELADFSGEPVQQTLEEARAEEAASKAASGHQEPEDGSGDGESSGGTGTPARIKLKWTKPMQEAVLTAINDYLQSAGAMPSVLDLYEILKKDDAFAHTVGQLNHKGAPLFSPTSLQAGVNAIRKSVAKDIAAEIKLNGTTDLAPLPKLAKVQTTRTPRVSDARALGLMIANLPALKALREAEMAAGGGNDSGATGEDASESGAEA
jgi:hypothetical protein